MYGLLHSANRRLAHLAAAAAAAPYSERFLRAFSSTAGVGDLVYVGKGYKICGKDEIEGESESYTHCLGKLNNERKVLPPELQSRNVVKLTCDSSAAGGICDVYLVGSDHICHESWREVKNVTSFLKPEVVFLELCSRRLTLLKGQPLKVPTVGEMFELWKNNEDPFWILRLWFDAKCFNREYDEWLSGQLGVAYNELNKYDVKVILGDRPDHSSNQQECFELHEWLSGDSGVAYKEAMKYGGKVILGDRPIHITVRREYAALSPWVSLYGLDDWLIEEVFPEMLKAEDDIEYVNLVAEEVDKKLSTRIEVIVGERDRYMSAKILEVAREHNSVVAVVGSAHLAGIQEYWKQPVDMKEIQEILSIPAGNKIATMGKLLNTFAAMVTFLFLSESQRDTFRSMMVAFYSRRLKMKNPKLGWWPKSPRH